MRISDWSSDVCSSDLSGPEQSQIPVIPPIPAYAERVSILPPLVHHGPDAQAEFDKMIDQPREYPEHRMIGAEEKRPDIIRKYIDRSEEHTSELQSLMRISYAVFYLKKKNNTKNKQASNMTQTQLNVKHRITTTK